MASWLDGVALHAMDHVYMCPAGGQLARWFVKFIDRWRAYLETQSRMGWANRPWLPRMPHQRHRPWLAGPAVRATIQPIKRRRQPPACPLPGIPVPTRWIMCRANGSSSLIESAKRQPPAALLHSHQPPAFTLGRSDNVASGMGLRHTAQLLLPWIWSRCSNV